jgi:hypothetical protein
VRALFLAVLILAGCGTPAAPPAPVAQAQAADTTAEVSMEVRELI